MNRIGISCGNITFQSKQNIESQRSKSSSAIITKTKQVAKHICNSLAKDQNEKNNKFKMAINRVKKFVNKTSEDSTKTMKRSHSLPKEFRSRALEGSIPVADVCIHKILKYLTLHEVANFGCTNYRGRAHQKVIFIKFARELGYFGKDFIGASEFIKKFLNEADYLNGKKRIHGGEFLFSEISYDWKSLLPEEVLSVLSNEATYFYEFDATIAYFFKKANLATLTPDQNKTKLRALVYASMYGQTTAVEFLLNQGCNVNERFEDGNFAIHHAATKNHLGVVKLLVEKGANVNVKDAYGFNPLRLASMSLESSRVELVEYLLQKGAVSS